MMLFVLTNKPIFPADEVVYVDFDFIEKNHGYFVQRIMNKRHDNELIEELSITKPSLVDIRDLSSYEAMLILQGKAIWLTEPTVPHVFLHEIGSMFENDLDPCERSIDAHAVQMNEIMEDKDRQKRKVIFVLPDGVECCAYYKDVAPLMDQRILPGLRLIKRQGITLSGGRKFNHLFLPITWKLCIVDGCRKILQRQEEQECDLFAQLTKGMKNMDVEG